MDAERRWRIVEQQRLAIADLLETLPPDRWESPSLCTDWRVQDVAAHVSLVGLPPSPGELLAQGLLARGNFNRLNATMAVRRAARPPDRLLAELREHAASRKVPVVSNAENALFDVLVHAQDIAIPLGVDLPMPLDGGLAGATRVWRMGWPFWAKRRLRGVRLTATDVDWAVGSGPLVEGPIRAVLLLLTGRTGAALPLLSGQGTARLQTLGA